MPTQKLNQRQREVLQWIADGCPPRDWPDLTYKNSALALQNRHLVKIQHRGGIWSAELTDLGRSWVTDGPVTPTPRRRTSPSAGETRDRNWVADPAVTDVLEQVEEAGGVLVLSELDDGTRAAYRRAISHVVSKGEVPIGQTLTYSGRDAGVMTIRVAPVKSPTDAPQPIAVAEALTSQHPVVDSLNHDGDLLPVSEASRDRALRIIEAIVLAAVERGWRAEVRPDREPGFRLHAGEDVVDLVVREEFAPATTYDPGAIGEVKYAWQRVAPQVTDVATGRLRIDVVTGLSWDKGSVWADRKRWTLESRLGYLVRELEQGFQRARDLRAHAEKMKSRQVV